MNDELIGIVRFYTKKEKTLCRIYLSVHKKNSFVFPENHVIPNILQRPPPLPPPPDKYWLVSDETTNQVLKITTSKRSTSLPDED